MFALPALPPCTVLELEFDPGCASPFEPPISAALLPPVALALDPPEPAPEATAADPPLPPLPVAAPTAFWGEPSSSSEQLQAATVRHNIVSGKCLKNRDFMGYLMRRDDQAIARNCAALGSSG
jgi:hypothetical protein